MSYGTVQAEKMTTESGYSLGAGNASTFKNRLINGGMVFDQRNNGSSLTIPSGAYTYTLDRWAAYASQASKFSVQRNAGSVTPPAGFINYLGATVGASANVTVGSSDIFIVRQAIEGLNMADLGWGAAGAQPITISFWVRSSLTGVFGGSINTNYATISYPFTYTINSANTWEYKTISLPGPTTGGTAAWPVDTQQSLRLNFSLGTGSTYLGTAGAWVSSDFFSATGSTNLISTNSATWYMTGCQVEVGTVATSFDFRDYGRELIMCQRYYQTFSAPSYKYLTSTTASSGYSVVIERLAVVMRGTPSVGQVGGSTTCTLINVAANTSSTVNISLEGVSNNTIRYYPASGMFTSQAYLVALNDLFTSSEL